MSCYSTPCNTKNLSGCGVELCSTTKLSTNSVIYTGPTLACSGISSCDTLTDALQKLDFRLCNMPAFTFTASNGITKNSNNFELGGPLTQQTVITTTAVNSLVIPGLVTELSPAFLVSQDTSGVMKKTPLASILGSILANNGITKTGNTIQLGGALISPTTVTTSATNVLKIAGLVINNSPKYIIAEGDCGQLVRTTISSILPPPPPTPPVITSDNGLTKTLNNIQLGGPLIKNTVVDLDTFNLSLLDVTTDTGVILKPGAANPTDYNIDTTKIRGKLNVNKFSHFEDNVGVGTPADTGNGSVRLNVLKTSILNPNPAKDSFATTNSTLGLISGSTDANYKSYTSVGGGLYVGFTAAQSLNVNNIYAGVLGTVNYSSRGNTTGGNLSAFSANFSLGEDAPGAPTADLDKLIGYRVKYPESRAVGGWTQTLTDFVGVQIDNARTQMSGGINGTITNSWGIRQLGPLDRNFFAGNVGIGFQPDAAVDIAGDGNNAKLVVGRLTGFRAASQTTSIDSSMELILDTVATEDPNIISGSTSRLVIYGKPGGITLNTPLMGSVFGYPQLVLKTGEHLDNNAGSPISAVLGRVYLTRLVGTNPGGNVGKIAAIRAHCPTNDALKGYGGTIANAYGVYIDNQRDQMNGNDPALTGTITNSFGIYQDGIDDQNIFKAEYNVFPNVIPLNYANDVAAAAGGVPLGGLYHTTGTLKIRIV